MTITRAPTKVWHLAMRSPRGLRPGRDPGPDAAVVHAAAPLGSLNKWFYVEIGRDHHWVDRLVWDDAAWQRYAADAKLETWMVTDRGTPAGYAELWKLPRGRWHVAMFGLLAQFRGRGLGGHLLTAVARRAWSGGASTVTLDTCELDGPYALPNYRARGFEVVRESIEQRGRSDAPGP